MKSYIGFASRRAHRLFRTNCHHSLNCITLSFIIILIIVNVQNAFSEQPLNPSDNAELNYTQLMFQWSATNEADEYRLQIAEANVDRPFENALIQDIRIPTNAHILNESLQWGNQYVWKWSDQFTWSPVYHFSIMEYPDSIRNFQVPVINRDLVQPGLTLFDLLYESGLGAVDINANLVWYKYLRGNAMDLELLPNGNMLVRAGGKITEFDINGVNIFRSDNFQFHHEVELLPNGNYIAIHSVRQWVENPVGEGRKLWRGDRIVEINRNNDMRVIWDAFEELSLEDYDSELFAEVPDDGEFDWTHTNACHYIPVDESIIISIRHLSRVIKISYPEGELIWSMGKEFPSGDVDFGIDLNFSWQHNPQQLSNGHILMFDNHNLGPEDSSRGLELSIDFDREEVAQIEWQHWLNDLSQAVCDAERLMNGNTLMVASPHKYFSEVTDEGEEVWRMTWDTGATYRADRVPNLYPLVYTIKGPLNEHLIPDGESYFQFKINNLGHLDQNFIFSVTDEQGWFSVDRSEVVVEAGESRRRMIFGFTPQGEHINSVTINVHPELKPDLEDSWNFSVISSPELSLKKGMETPQTKKLTRAYPNPFNSLVVLEFTGWDYRSESVFILDLNGRIIRKLGSENSTTLIRRTMWDGKDGKGEQMPTGVYFYRVEGSNKMIIGKVLLIR